MNQPFKFRYVNELAGGFVLLGLVLLIVGFYVAGHAQGWFEKNLVLWTSFSTDEGTFGLQEGAEIRILGTLAGRIAEIKPGQQGGMVARLEIKGKFKNFVRKDSIGKVKKKFAVAGDSYIEITLGTATAGLMRSGDTIKCEQDVELIETAKRILDDVREELVPVLEEFRQILTNVRGVTGQLEEGQGTIGRLLRDKTLADQVATAVADIQTSAAGLTQTVAKLDGVVTNAHGVVESVNLALVHFPGLAAEAEGTVRNVRYMTDSLTGEVAGVQGVMLEAQDAMRELDRLIEGLQNHWLIRGAMQTPGKTELLAPVPGAEPGGAP